MSLASFSMLQLLDPVEARLMTLSEGERLEKAILLKLLSKPELFTYDFEVLLERLNELTHKELTSSDPERSDSDDVEPV